MMNGFVWVLAFLIVNALADVAEESVGKVDCNAWDDVAKNQEEFEHCLLSGEWRQPLLLGQAYDVTENGDCEWCVGAMPNVLRLLKQGQQEGQKTTAEQVRDQFMTEVCASINSMDKREMCHQITNTYYKQIIALVGSGVGDEKMCSLLGVCSVRQDVCYSSPSVVCADRETAQRCKREDACLKYVWSRNDDFSHIVDEIKGEVVADNAECEECEMVMDKVKQFVSDSTNRQTVIDKAEDICERFFSQDECDEYVGETLGTLMELIVTEVTSSEICSAAGLCKSSSQQGTAATAASLAPSRLAPPAGLLGADECVHSLEVICADPGLRVRCEKTMVCSDMFKYGYTFGSAKYGVAPSPSTDDSVKSNVVECDACEEMVASAKQYLQDEQVQEEIERELLKVCTIYPMDGECAQYIKEYFPTVIALLEQYMDSETICEMIGMCATPSLIDVESCPSGQTECFQDACCPLPDAVCCADQLHCCPGGYSCEQQFCEKTDTKTDTINRTFKAFVKNQDDKLSNEIGIRKRRQAASEVEMESIVPPSIGQWIDLERLAGIAQGFMSQMRESGACSACKMAVQYAYERDMNEAASIKKVELTGFMSEVRSKVCEQMEKVGSSGAQECPLSDESVEVILEAAEAHKDSMLDENGVVAQCPIEALCQPKSTQLSRIVDMVNTYMCSTLTEVEEWINMDSEEHDQQWEALENKLKSASVEAGESERPLWAAKMGRVVEHVRLMRQQLEDSEVKDTVHMKKVVLLEALKKEMPAFQKCVQ